MEVTSKIQNNNFKLKKKKLYVKVDCGNAKMKQIKSLEQCLPVLRGHCIDCFREYSDRATSSCCCRVKDSTAQHRASPDRDRRRRMSCSGLQHRMEYFFLKGRLLWHRRWCIRGWRSQNAHDSQKLSVKNVNNYESVSLLLVLLSSTSVFR